jgi:hypothetical protein
MNGRRCIATATGVGLAILLSLVCAGTDVVINEIGWGGTAASTSDEWIELFNPTDEAIDLSGWTLVFGETVIHLGTVEGDTREVRGAALAAGGYFLLERSDDGTIADIDADVLYVGALPNGGIVVELRDATGGVVDRVDAVEGWPAGTAGDGEPPHASMERIDPFTETASWASNDGTIRNGTDVGGGAVNGTPGSENGARILALTAPRVELTAPSEEGAVLSGIVIVEWTAVDPDGTAEALGISIDLSLDDGETWEVVVENLANGGNYAWDTTLHSDGDEVRLRVVAVDGGGRRGTAESPLLTIENGE